MTAKGERTRESIIDASYALFAKKGFKQVTMKDVCDVTNMSRGGLYSHFSSTSQLFEALLEKMTERSETDIQEATGKGASALSILVESFASLEEETGHPEDSLSIAMLEYAQTVDAHVMEQLNRIGAEKWKKLIRYGIKRGEFKAVDVDEIVNLILYSYQGVRMWSMVSPMKPEVYHSITENIKRQLIGETR
ncbi:MAG: TetR/AcrR family transcriptional regulator [Lachnospiraceae bacterium]|nr:TetR/AcrR family transcriptional regulator [Lachnospiraceae bacterium]